MPTYAVSLPDGRHFEVTSDHPLSDAEAHQHAVSAGGGTEPGTFWGGFADHLLTKEKPAVAALASLPLALGGAAGAIPAAAVDAGMAVAPTVADGASRLWNLVHGKPQDPVSGGELFEDAMGPAAVYGPGAVVKGAKWLGNSPIASRVVGAAGGAATGSPLGHPVIGALIGEREAGPAVQKAAKVIGSLERTSPGKLLAGADNGPLAEIDPYMPNRGRVSREVPGSRYVEPVAPSPAAPSPRPAPPANAPRLAGKAPTLEDSLNDALNSVRQEPTAPASSRLPDTPSVRHVEPPASLKPLTHRFGPPKEATAGERLQSLFGDETPVRETPPDSDEASRFLHLFGDESPGRGSVSSAEPMAGDAGAEFHSVGEPTAPQAKVDAAVNSLTGSNGDGPSYTDFAASLDKTINQTTPEDLAQFPNQNGLRTKAWRDYITKGAASHPPYRDITDQYR